MAQPVPPAVDIQSGDVLVARLLDDGFALLPGPFIPEEAWVAADLVARAAEPRSPLGKGMPSLEEVGRFLIPPRDVPRRRFQVLHLDFGLPVDPHSGADVARYTFLHVARTSPASTAQTRIVRLSALLSQRAWPAQETIIERLRSYGVERGGCGGRNYVEGILARLVEGAAETPRSLPRSGEGGLPCGLEFADLDTERAHFLHRGLDLDRVERRVQIRPGELLVIDNLATAHGRLGRREPEELHQLMLGHRGLEVESQRALRDQTLAAFQRSTAG